MLVVGAHAPRTYVRTKYVRMCCHRRPKLFPTAGMPLQDMAIPLPSQSSALLWRRKSGGCRAKTESLPPSRVTSGDVDQDDDETVETSFHHQEDENECWEKRVQRRTECIEATKRRHAYQRVRARSGRPKTPDPNWRISKRCWERLAAKWRFSVKVEAGPLHLEFPVLHDGVSLVQALEALALNEPLYVQDPWCRHWGNPYGGHQCVGGRSLLLGMQIPRSCIEEPSGRF